MSRPLRIHGKLVEIVRAGGGGPLTSQSGARDLGRGVQGERVRFGNEHQALSFLSRARSTSWGAPRALREMLIKPLGGAAVSRMTDVEIAHTVARFMVNGLVHVYEAPAPAQLYGTPPVQAEPALGPAPEADESYFIAGFDAASEPEQIEAVLAGASEPEEMHAVLEGASEPEEIHSALEAASEPQEIHAVLDALEPEIAEDTSLDADAQADALEQAAAAGVPFCEECEKARLAAAGAAAQDAVEEKESEETASLDAAAQADTMRRAADDGVPFCEECEKAKAAAAAAA